MRAFTTAASTKMAANTATVCPSAPGENTKANPAACATSASNSADVTHSSSWDKPSPTTRPTASEAAPTTSDSHATMRTTSEVRMPSTR